MKERTPAPRSAAVSAAEIAAGSAARSAAVSAAEVECSAGRRARHARPGRPANCSRPGRGRAGVPVPEGPCGPARDPDARRRGFLLMEVLISVMIMAVAMAILIESIRNSISTAQLSTERTKAAYLAQLKMWEMEDLLYWKSDVEGYERHDTFDNPNADYEWDVDVESDEDLSEHIVTVRVTWEHRRDVKKSYELVTVVPMDRDSDKYLK